MSKKYDIINNRTTHHTPDRDFAQKRKSQLHKSMITFLLFLCAVMKNAVLKKSPEFMVEDYWIRKRSHIL